MKITSRVISADGACTACLRTNGAAHELVVDAKPNGEGLRANGGEMLCTALASCFCNDIYREAAPRGIEIVSVEVEVSAEFGGPGEPARSLSYRAHVAARAPEHDIQALIEHTETVAEVQNTLRQGLSVRLTDVSGETCV